MRWPSAARLGSRTLPQTGSCESWSLRRASNSIIMQFRHLWNMTNVLQWRTPMAAHKIFVRTAVRHACVSVNLALGNRMTRHKHQQEHHCGPQRSPYWKQHTLWVAPVHGQVVAVAGQAPGRRPALQRPHVSQQLPQLPHLRLQPASVQVRRRRAAWSSARFEMWV